MTRTPTDRAVVDPDDRREARTDPQRSPGSTPPELDTSVPGGLPEGPNDATDGAVPARTVSAVVDAAHALLTRERTLADGTARRSYASMLERLLSPGLLDAIAMRLTSEPERYDRDVDLLDRAGDSGAVAVVRRMVRAPTLAERRRCFDLLQSLDAAVPVLMLMLHDPHREVVCNAAELLGVMEVPEAHTALTALRGHEEESVRRAAAVALARLGAATAPSDPGAQ